MTSTTIERVRATRADGVHQEWPFDQKLWYVITDEHPYLDLEVSGFRLTAADKRLGKQLQDGESSKGTFWQRWSLAETLSDNRRMGQFVLPLKVPTGVVLQCYVVPSKLLDVADFLAMVHDVQAELGRPVAWDPDRQLRLRSWSREDLASRVSMTTLLLDQVREELVVARSLRHNPVLEPGRTPGRLGRAPENSLVSHWAARRAAQLADAIEQRNDELQEYQRRSREHAPERRTEAKAAMASAALELDELLALRSLVLHQVAIHELGTAIVFGPLLQRDHRFRRLLRAFAPPASEVVTETESRWSQFPPVSFNSLFERWGAVWIVHRVRELGFVGGAELMVGTDALQSCRWRLERGDTRIVVDYEPQPALLDFADLPPIDARQQTANEWAVARQFVDPARPLFGSRAKCSPDYVLRIEGPHGRVLAVGDACLADPAHHHKANPPKPRVVADYRDSIVWWVDGRLQGCDPMGGFVLFPGPPEKWGELERQFLQEDVWFICPKPRGADGAVQQRFQALLGRLVAKVS